MNEQNKLVLFAVLVLIIAIGFLMADVHLTSRLRSGRGPSRAERGAVAGRARYLVALFVLGILSFPAATFSLVASFAAPWQLLWPSALLFLVSGIVGLTSAILLLFGAQRRVVAITLALFASLGMSFLALSVVLVRYR